MDVGFVGFNTYSRPDQLQSGMLANSSNGRIGKNGEWQVRKGISVIKAPFASGDAVLRLPTSSETQVNPPVVGLLPTTIRSASLASDKVLIVVDNPAVLPGHIFAVGDTVYVEGLTGTPDPDGSHTVTAVTDNGDGTKTIEYELVGADVAAYGGFALTLPFNLDDGGTEPALTTITLSPVIGFNMVLDQGNVAGVYSSTTFSDPNQTNSQFIILASNVSAVATDLNDTSVSITMGYPSGENVPPASSMLQAFNKIFIFRDGQTALENDKFFSPVSIASASTGAASNIASVTTSGKHGLVIGDAITIAGLTGFPGEGDPAVTDQDPNGTWTVKTVADDTSFTYDLPVVYQDAATYTVSAASKISPAFKRVESGTYTQPTQIVCAAGEFAIINSRGVIHQTESVVDGNILSVISPSQSSQTSGLTLGETFNVARVYEQGPTKVITAAVNNGTAHGNAEYTGLYQIVITSTSHGYDIGDPITIAGFGDTKTDGKRYVAERTVDTVTFYIPDNGSVTTDGNQTVNLADGIEFYIDAAKTTEHATDGESLSATPVFTKQVSVGLGFSHMPAPEYATYHQRRLVMPFKYTVNDAEDSFTYRKVLDEVITSDILDSDTYDQIYAQFRFNAGTADFNVGLHSFSDDKLLVFNRNSIHLVGGAGQSAATQLITNEVGCVARKTIIQVGNNVLFLSDNGVYGANFQDLYNLRGNEVPLSSPINSIIQRINRDVWDKSVGVYFDNRYYLAVPLNEEVVTAQVGTAQVGQPGDSNFVAASSNFVAASRSIKIAQVNNAILIFNLINKQWESIDTTNAPDWDISDLIVGGKKSDRAVYAINSLGGLHRLDARIQSKDLLATTIPVSGAEAEVPYDIPASVTTRQFTLGSMDRKRWNNFELHVQSSADEASDLSISAELENLDTTVDLGSLRALNSGTTLDPDEDVSVRGRIGNKRAYGMQVTLNNTVGRPRFRGIKVGGAEAFRSTNTAI
jgi:hypothetical protein